MTFRPSTGDELAQQIKEICERYQVPRRILKNRNGGRNEVEARWAVWHYLNRERHWTLTQIARRFEKHHTTVMHGIRKHSLSISR